VLVTGELSVTDDFFERGGDSLSAIRLVARVQRRYGLELPISTLIEAPTVRALARVITRGAADAHEQTRGAAGAHEQTRGVADAHDQTTTAAGARAATPALVRLNASDSIAARAPVFCVHPIGGNVLCYMPLARQLGRRRPVYGLQARGLHAGENPYASIPEMASAYAREMLEVQPSGPIHIAGWSFGGIVAVEIARQLAAAGRELAPVVVVDTMASIRLAVAPSETDVLEGFALELFGAALDGEEWDEIFSPTSGLEREVRIARLIARARADGLVPDGVGSEQLERVFAVMRASLESFNTYEQRPFGGELILLRCLDAMPGRLRRMHDLIGSSYEDRTNGWGRYCPKVTVVPVQGDHLTIVREPHVAQIGRIIRRVLGGRGVEPAAGGAPARDAMLEGGK
jgi:thioesterase domain-containing protein/acyl carrier protein